MSTLYIDDCFSGSLLTMHVLCSAWKTQEFISFDCCSFWLWFPVFALLRCGLYMTSAVSWTTRVS